MDVMLAFVKNQYGDAAAKNAANSLEYEWHADANWDPFSKIWNVPEA
jgi:hypothetical protein